MSDPAAELPPTALQLTVGLPRHGEDNLYHRSIRSLAGGPIVFKTPLRLVGNQSCTINEADAAAGDAPSKRAARVSILKPAPVRLAPSADELNHRIAEELCATQRRLEQLRSVLNADPVVSCRHANSVAALNYAEQVLGQLASVIDKEDAEAAVEELKTSALKARLQRTAIRPMGFN